MRELYSGTFCGTGRLTSAEKEFERVDWDCMGIKGFPIHWSDRDCSADDCSMGEG